MALQKAWYLLHHNAQISEGTIPVKIRINTQQDRWTAWTACIEAS